MKRLIDLDELLQYPLRRGSEHYDEKNADPHFLFGVESVLEYAQTLPTLTQPNNWISVEDRLPEDGKYLCCFSSLGLGWCIDVLSYASDLNSVDDWDFYNEHRGGFYDLDSECGYYEISGVAYWRPASRTACGGSVMTNFEKLKNMTPEQIAAEFMIFRPSDACFDDENRNYYALDGSWHQYSQDCFQANVKWLNEEIPYIKELEAELTT